MRFRCETAKITDVDHRKRQVRGLTAGKRNKVKIDNIFTTRGDIFHTELAER